MVGGRNAWYPCVMYIFILLALGRLIIEWYVNIRLAIYCCNESWIQYLRFKVFTPFKRVQKKGISKNIRK